MTPADLKALAAVMVEMRIATVKLPDLVIEMHASAFAPTTSAAAELPPEREPTMEEIAFASSIPVTDAEREGREPT